MPKIFNVTALVTAFILSVGLAQAETRKATSEYRIKVHGFPIAKINFATEINGDNYTIQGKIKSSALADIVGKTRGDTKVVGKISPTHLQAKSYKINYTTGKKSRRFDVEYD